ncbi:hypothetical protein GLAREA_08438 [Glarea lozoyensis ATCC 20868]|uniref:Non-homologous end-joining factor 1 n=1 Tax=Glarea lozoyensis (strain ATCC 20868 / MF5171) TaxID=1116229 RepID=S3CXM1_GLAL2|nr:uncharacterized protein GLAREA_08438 [Glarea lozoyensis ATCC 20868]EPE24586.1 hypothetical protein GLAREA_08438 [Glarea lozoyensis ATCC 20868]
MAGWKPLSLSASASAHLPPLLFSVSFDHGSSYTVYLTDLTHIWSESLSRRQIIRRSQEEKTSIDPSDDEDNLRKLLEKIKSALEGARNTTAALTINADDERPSLTLSLAVKLPAGIAPLEWPLRLSAVPQTTLTQQLILPLMEAQHMRLQETASLIEVLKEKDHVIQKLLDKLEGQGTELGELFPQAAGKAGRKIDRRKAEERVRGLALFDIDAWRSENQIGAFHDTQTLLSKVFQGDANQVPEVGTEKAADVDGTWWEDIKGLTVFLDSGKIKTALGKAKPPGLGLEMSSHDKSSSNTPVVVEKHTEDSDSGDFQVQSTPPHLKPNIILPSESRVESSTDSDDDDLDAPSQRSKLSASQPVSQQTSGISLASEPKDGKKLGALAVKSRARVVRRSFVQPPDVINDESSTEDEDEDEDEISARKPYQNVSTASLGEDAPSPAKSRRAVSPDESSPEATPKRKGRGIGKLGGKQRPVEASPSPPPKATPEPSKKRGKLGKIGGKKAILPDGDETEDPATETTPKKKKLGAIGGRKRESSSPGSRVPDANEEVVIRGRSEVAKVERNPTPEVRETSQERADKKRAALKRELEAKAKAPPVKKKRKF